MTNKLADALRPLVAAYIKSADPLGDSELYDEQPRALQVTLGDCRRAAMALLLHDKEQAAIPAVLTQVLPILATSGDTMYCAECKKWLGDGQRIQWHTGTNLLYCMSCTPGPAAVVATVEEHSEERFAHPRHEDDCPLFDIAEYDCAYDLTTCTCTVHGGWPNR